MARAHLAMHLLAAEPWWNWVRGKARQCRVPMRELTSDRSFHCASFQTHGALIAWTIGLSGTESPPQRAGALHAAKLSPCTVAKWGSYVQ